MSLLPQSLRLWLIAGIIAAPAVAGALVIALVETDQARQRTAMRDKPPVSFAEAICDDRVEQAHGFIWAGADPNAPIPFRDEEFTGNREVMVSPLMLAVACHRENTVVMLLNFGARPDAPANRHARCLARATNFDEAAALLEHDGTSAPNPDCPAAQAGPPLLAYSR